MRKFIHSDFQIDLSPLKITDTAENPWFSGQYFAKYSYPFNLPLTEELDALLGLISNFNASGTQTYFEGTYVHGNQMEKAILEIEEMTDVLSVTIRYGLDDFPNFNKKLAELQLLNIPVGDIYEHAKDVIQLNWPQVAYNFPQIHIDKIDTEDSEVWGSFEKIINNYKNGEFLRNTVDVAEEITYNRNIMQPLPYLLYLMSAGFADAGYSLKGDVLEDSDLKKTLVYADVEYYTNVSQESIPILIMSDDYDTFDNDNKAYPHITLTKEYQIGQPGKYRLVGNARLRRRSAGTWTYVRVYYRNILIVKWELHNAFHRFLDYKIDAIFDTVADDNQNMIRVEYDAGYAENDVLFDLSLNPIVMHDDAGEVIASVVNANTVDLSRAVPDVTFGDLVKFVLTAFNMDLSANQKEICINYVSNEIRNRPVIDLANRRVKFPKRVFSRGTSYLMQYQDVSSDDYKYDVVFQNADGVQTTGYTTDDKTTEINLNAVPLPLLYRNDVQTAHAFLSDNTKLALVTYTGSAGTGNLSSSSANLFVPALHERFHRSWLASRINSEAYTWTFLEYYENLIGLTAKSRVHAYNNIHLVTSVQKTEIAPDLFEVEIETEVFKN